LTVASGPVLEELGFLHPRGGLHLARAEDVPALDAFAQEFAEAGVDLPRGSRRDGGAGVWA
jgi:D-arginine dehydrogenase